MILSYGARLYSVIRCIDLFMNNKSIFAQNVLICCLRVRFTLTVISDGCQLDLLLIIRLWFYIKII